MPQLQEILDMYRLDPLAPTIVVTFQPSGPSPGLFSDGPTRLHGATQEAFRSWQRGEVVQLLAGACDAGPCPLPSVEAARRG